MVYFVGTDEFDDTKTNGGICEKREETVTDNEIILTRLKLYIF